MNQRCSPADSPVPANPVPANPFCTRFTRPGSVGYRFAAADSDEDTEQKNNLLANSIAEIQRAAIVGPHGSGKSTLLQSLSPCFKDRFSSLASLQLQSPGASSGTSKRLTRIRHRLNNSILVHKTQLQLWRQSKRQHIRHQRNEPPSSLLVIDGFEQLTAAQQWRTTRIAQYCKQNLLVTTHFPIRTFDRVHQSQPQASVILRLTNELLEPASASTQSLVDDYLARCDLSQVADVREFWFGLYDVVADAGARAGHAESTVAANR